MNYLDKPRILVAGTGSGVGKTTLVLALTKALQAKGLKVSVFKCGPDYLDPTYHSYNSGRTCQNLDGWLMGKESVISTFQEASRNSDISLIEGVMGLFDGHSPGSQIGSSAEIAKWLRAPVLVAIDASGMAGTIAAIASGMKNFDPDLSVQGFLANFVGSKNHIDLLTKALFPLSLLGGFPKSPEQAFPERHLGLHSANHEILTEEKTKFWRELAEEWLDLEEIITIARQAPAFPSLDPIPELTKPADCKIGVAYDSAFHFYYEENLAELRKAGAELVFFSPLSDQSLPDLDGLYIGGGYPELHAEALSRNRTMLESIRNFAESGKPLYAECGGLMYLSKSIQDLNGSVFPMLGIIPGTVTMSPKLKALGYAEVQTERDTFLGEAGTRFRGHQFRYSDLILDEESEEIFSYKIRKRRSDVTSNEGYTIGNVLGSYVHAHWASNPSIPKRFVSFCRNFSR